MANTLTSLIPDLYVELDVVSRELTGFIPAVTRDTGVERAALNQTVRSSVAPAASSANNTAAVTPPDTGDQTIGNKSITISKSKHVPIRWNGEEIRGINTGSGHRQVLMGQFQQAFRTLANEMNADLAALAVNASRAAGTYNATPFATAGDFSDASAVAKILKDNGAPLGDLQLVLNTTAGANFGGKQSRYDIQGDRTMLTQGIIGMNNGMTIRESAGITAPTVGTGASYVLNGALAVGDTTVAVDTGSGTILAGDIVTIGNHKYVVATALAAGSFTVNLPGIRETVADGANVTVIALTARNMAFSRSALVLATRMPALPEGGDMATDIQTVVDPVSGIAFEIAEYKQFMQTSFHVRAAWGVGCEKSEHLALMIGNV
jgi:hypothetical protein